MTHLVRLDPAGTSEEERERLQDDFAALLASGQPLLGGTSRVAESARPDAREPGARPRPQSVEPGGCDPAAAQNEGRRA
jgi:hypothetical protein